MEPRPYEKMTVACLRVFVMSDFCLINAS